MSAHLSAAHPFTKPDGSKPPLTAQGSKAPSVKCFEVVMVVDDDVSNRVWGAVYEIQSDINNLLIGSGFRRGNQARRLTNLAMVSLSKQ